MNSAKCARESHSERSRHWSRCRGFDPSSECAGAASPARFERWSMHPLRSRPIPEKPTREIPCRCNGLKHGSGNDLRSGACQMARGAPSLRRAGPRMRRAQAQNFPARVAHFFGRCADHTHGEANLIGHFGCGQRCANRRCGDNVVAACESDARQAIVFGANPDVQKGPLSCPRAKRRWKIADALFHREAGVGQRFTEPGRGVSFGSPARDRRGCDG